MKNNSSTFKHVMEIKQRPYILQLEFLINIECLLVYSLNQLNYYIKEGVKSIFFLQILLFLENMDLLLCNKVGHQNQPIIALCTFKGCQNVRTCCGKCVMNDHISHHRSVIQLEYLHNQYSNNHPLLQLVDDLRNTLNQILNEIQMTISSIGTPIYPQEVNLTNMNKFAGQLAQGGIIDSTKIKESLVLSNQVIMSTLKRCLNSIKPGSEEQMNERKTEAMMLRIQGEDLILQGKYEEAMELLDRSIEIYDQDEICWNLKGLALMKIKKYQQAIECYDQAILINPNDSIMYHNKAVTLHGLNKLQESLECMNKAIDLSPNDFDSWNKKGLLLVKMNQQQEALKCFQKLVEIAPDATNYFNLALCLEDLGRKEEALKYYQEAVKIHPNYLKAINKVQQLKNI